MREARRHDFMLFGLGRHIFVLVEWALVVGAVGFAAERMQSGVLEGLSYVLRAFVLLKSVEIVLLVGEHFTGIHTAKEFEEKFKDRKPKIVIVLMFFGYFAGMLAVGLPALFLTEKLLETARQIAEAPGTP